ncbi:DUF2256 domain-containing protein [Limnohabitans sp. Rim28]|uniref:DUF2256 domain-containing protein n=1 Tax=Limnohabitans sp. Rim28 TaxID=1100720 RepID=UPI0009D9AA83|nr:DUF2256 domain-containing protein [Limnohabitans sp. Rim28]PVE07028.1 hypothetical protein B472_09860 [Limnohabitans sp. Rim28]
MPKPSGFKGNKQDLPQKPCVVCGRAMSWRKSWAKNWDQVLYCSDRCRADKPKSAHAGPAQTPPMPGKKAAA